MTFEGNGASVVGQISIISSSGDNIAGQRCTVASDLISAVTPGFIQVGVSGADNTGIVVTINDLDIEEVHAVAVIWENASLIINDSAMARIYALPKAGGCRQAAVQAYAGASFEARRTEWSYLAQFAGAPLGIVFNGAISGSNAGVLTIVDSYFEFVWDSGVIQWSGGVNSDVNIVSSRFYDTGGMVFNTQATSNIVNSIWSTEDYGNTLDDRIINGSSEQLNIIASTLSFGSVGCNVNDCAGDAGRRGLVHRLPGAGTINFIESAIGVDLPDVPLSQGYLELLDPDSFDPNPPAFGFSADENTWIQPTGTSDSEPGGQDAATLKLLTNQPNLLTDAPGLPTFPPFLSGQVQRATPLVPGELLDRIANAACTEANELINPIDQTCITQDALGNDRVDGNGSRNIGAVQLNEAPHLSVIAVGDGTVDLSWTKPRDVTGLCGYRLTYREVGTANDVSVDILDPDTLTRQVTGLTNGVDYEFEVEGLADCTTTPVVSGFPSNLVTATPMGQLGIAQPTAVTSGDGSLKVDWNAPTDLGGFSGQLSYNVVYRPVGTQTWINGPQGITALTATLTGLVNGTTYEIGVLAQTTDGGLSPTPGTINGTPQAAPTLSYATPGTWPQDTPLTLTPTVTQLQGAGAYTIQSGALPWGMGLDPITGVISGTPTTASQSLVATIRLTDGTTGLFTEAMVPLSIVALPPSPQLWYPVIQTTVGVGPVSATPTQANIPAGATFSVVAGESLPGGFGINATSGVISGTPTTAPGAGPERRHPGLLGRLRPHRRRGAHRTGAVLHPAAPAVPGQHQRHRRCRDHHHPDRRPLERRRVQHQRRQPAGRHEPRPDHRCHQRHPADAGQHRTHDPLQHRGERLGTAAGVRLLHDPDQRCQSNDHPDLPGDYRGERSIPLGAAECHRFDGHPSLLVGLGLAPAGAASELGHRRYHRCADRPGRQLPGRDPGHRPLRQPAHQCGH